MKQFFCMFLCAFLLFSSFLIPAAAANYDETTYKLTGNEADDIIGIALTQVGYKESGTNITKYGQWFGGMGWNYEWCGVFVAWCAEKAGIHKSIVHSSSWVPDVMSAFQDRGLYESARSYTPKRGDLVFFDWNANDVPNHIGMVVEALPNGDVRVCDGNFENKVNNRVLTANAKEISYNRKSIMGYATPLYKTAPPMLSITNVVLREGESVRVSANVRETIADTVRWRSLDENIVSVDGAGNVLARSSGAASVVVTSAIGELGCEIRVLPQNFVGIPGDVDYDEVLDISDIVAMRMIVMSKVLYSGSHIKIADLDGDGNVDVSDVVALRNKIIMNQNTERVDEE